MLEPESNTDWNVHDWMQFIEIVRARKVAGQERRDKEAEEAMELAWQDVDDESQYSVEEEDDESASSDEEVDSETEYS